MKARTKSRIIRSNLFVVRLERQELFRASNCWRLSEARKTGNRSCRCSIATARGREGVGRGERSSGGRNAVDEVAGGDVGEGTAAGMRNRPAKLDAKLTVLLYVLTRRRGLDRIARAIPRRRAALLVTRWRWNTRRDFGKRTADIRGETIANCSRKLPRRIISDHRPRPLII